MKKDNSKRHQFFNSPMRFEGDFHPNTQGVINCALEVRSSKGGIGLN